MLSPVTRRPMPIAALRVRAAPASCPVACLCFLPAAYVPNPNVIVFDLRLQDKEAKVAYLTKMIDTVGLALNEHVPARPLKVRSRCCWKAKCAFELVNHSQEQSF